jgi:thiamine-phosphate pyrophosphorylase
VTPPTVLVLTDRHQATAAGRTLAATVIEAVAGGAPAILFREKDLPRDERRALGEAVAAACGQAELYVASDPDLARALDARGVHLAAADPWPEGELETGRSCHDGVELAEAQRRGAAYATLSPVFATAGKPGYGPPLGLCGLAALAEETATPVLALGGVTPERVRACREAGAAGVAVMGAVMGAADPATVVELLVSA